MPLVIIGVLLMLAKFAEFGPTAGWPWWAVLAPFGGAALWWAFADSIGITQRRAMQKMEDRKAERRERAMARCVTRTTAISALPVELTTF